MYKKYEASLKLAFLVVAISIVITAVFFLSPDSIPNAIAVK